MVKQEPDKILDTGDVPVADAPTETATSAAGQEDATEVVPSDPEPKSKGRCDYRDDDGRQCRYEKHSDRYPHLLEDEAPPQIVKSAAGGPVPVKRQTVNTWWCAVCDNSQQMTDIAVCRKCGATPQF